MAIRYALMMDHYRDDRMWSPELLQSAQHSILNLRKVLKMTTVAPTNRLLQDIIAALADDLNTPKVLQALDAWVEGSLAGGRGGDVEEVKLILDALLGIKL